ncbi:MAG TPA: hypothetical protein VMV10_04120 [Pirellulales bacterium]|nr:hypothetical protein [Pirellulales bacterium]
MIRSIYWQRVCYNVSLLAALFPAHAYQDALAQEGANAKAPENVKAPSDGTNQALRAKYYRALDACIESVKNVASDESADRVLAKMFTAAPASYVQRYLEHRLTKSLGAKERASYVTVIERIRELEAICDAQGARERVEAAVRQRNTDTLCTCLLVRSRGELQVAAAQALAQFPDEKAVRCLVRSLEGNAGGIGYGGAGALVEQVELLNAAIESLRVITGLEFRRIEDPGRLIRGPKDIDQEEFRKQLVHFHQEYAARCKDAIARAKRWLNHRESNARGRSSGDSCRFGRRSSRRALS